MKRPFARIGWKTLSAGIALLFASVSLDSSGPSLSRSTVHDRLDLQSYYVNRDGIELTGPGRISFPPARVAAHPREIFSGERNLRLENRNANGGWLLTGKVLLGHLIGFRTWERIPAELSFKSITWIRGGTGSTAGITVHPGGDFIEADPSFGVGVYDVSFEIALQVPAFAHADDYYGVSTFILQ